MLLHSIFSSDYFKFGIILQAAKKRLSSEAAASANRNGRWKNQMRRAAHNGCCRRAAQTRALCSVLWKLLISEGLVVALTSIEMPLVNTSLIGCYLHMPEQLFCLYFQYFHGSCLIESDTSKYLRCFPCTMESVLIVKRSHKY